MATSVVMPALEMAQETGKLVSWKKKEGEQVKKGEILLEVETDKAVVEIEAGSDGVLAGVTAKVDDVVPVGQTIAWLLKPGESVPASSGVPQQTGRKMDSAPAAAAAPVAAAAPEPASVAGAKISPKARRLAREHGVDIARVKGSGPGGEILADDIMKAAAGAPAPAPASASAAVAPPPAASARPASPPAAVQPGSDTGAVSSIGKIMAERTTQSWTQVPQFYVTRAVDASNLNASRARRVPEVERSHGVKVTHTDILVAAVARALRHFPRMNGSWNNGAIAMHGEVNVALAMAVENAVVTAVIKNADTLALGDIAKTRKELTERARANRLTPADIQGATFTISNLGMMEVDAFTAIIVPPQAGILAVGAIRDQVVASGGFIGIKPMMNLTLTSDHRVIDGARAAEFLNDVVAGLTDPDKWL
ncbi:MAG TPA: dihydrolipoamide acetyltransferase family protein [Vicinamibacterales bacterium]|jgi:pyruvate dehydrogenase E2 component (dihydrolipoamide acetyltransferase)|nr:dihydrolipoamide acetyltransferase family protein [Vicinamibacterales bacterium]